MKQYFDICTNVYTLSFLSQAEMGFVYSLCDLAITRAGTTSLAEQKLYNIKSILIPIARTHDQFLNAERYKNTYQDSVLDQRDVGFVNKLGLELKKWKTFKKSEYSLEQARTHIHTTKETIRKHILY